MKRGRLFIKCLILGEGSFSLIEKLHKMGVYVYDITFFEEKTEISIDFADRKKLFAISRNMCYNIRILKYIGKVSLLKKALSKLGLTACFLLFTAFAFLSDGYVSKIEYLGDGEYLSPKISSLLQSKGIEENTFLNENLKDVENSLLKELDGVSYISLNKSGRILTVEAYFAEDNLEVKDLKKSQILSTAKGKVRSLNVLSGMPKVSVGDEVNVGDVLIDGYFLKGEEKISSYALGEIEIEATYEYEYQSFCKGEKYQNRAYMLAKESLGEQNVISQSVKEEERDGKIVYRVILNYLVTVS